MAIPGLWRGPCGVSKAKTARRGERDLIIIDTDSMACGLFGERSSAGHGVPHVQSSCEDTAMAGLITNQPASPHKPASERIRRDNAPQPEGFRYSYRSGPDGGAVGDRL